MSMIANRNAVRTVFDSEVEKDISRTKQCFKDECDINRIIDRVLASGMPDAPPPVFGDVSHITPEAFLDMKNAISGVVGAFEKLPSGLRREYGSPEGLLAELERQFEDVQTSVSSPDSGDNQPINEVELIEENASAEGA